MKRLLPLLLLCAHSRPAAACGGFFCDRPSTPTQMPAVIQAGEEVLFAQDGTSIEVQVRIKYMGSDAAFAWILPTRKVPTLSVGIDATFVALEKTTTPAFRESRQQLGCGYSYGGGSASPSFGCGAEDAAAPEPPRSGADGAAFSNDAGVDVVSQGAVGPYETVVLQADDGAALRAWLTDNGYYLSATGSALLDPYVMEHDYFVALKLRADATASDIQPIVLRFTDSEPCVPLRLTAVAALDDMDVTVYLLGPARAVSTNYYDVELDWARMDWNLQSLGSDYRQLVSTAANEAGGRAFVTQYAGTAGVMSGRLSPPGGYDLTRMRAARDQYEFLAAFDALHFTLTGQVIAVLARWIPEPDAAVQAGISRQAFYACIGCYSTYLVGQPIDAQMAADDVQARIADPLAEAEQLFDRLPYLTRMYTTISPPEMTSDPTFAFNPDLPAVSNQEQATATMACDDGTPQPIAWSLPGSVSVKTYSFDRGALRTIPAATVWRQMSASGPGVIVGDNRDQIARFIAQQNSAVVDPAARPMQGGNDQAPIGCGCRITRGPARTLTGVVLLAFVLAISLRPRRPHR
jgi:hypothetical protein